MPDSVKSHDADDLIGEKKFRGSAPTSACIISLIGTEVTVLCAEEADKVEYKGLLSHCSPNFDIHLTHCQKCPVTDNVDNISLTKGNVFRQITLDSKNVISVTGTLEHVENALNKEKGKGFVTDSQISQKPKKCDDTREDYFEEWVPEDENNIDLDYSNDRGDNTNGNHQNRQTSGWSAAEMFDANKKFGLKTDFAEDLSQYTTVSANGTAEEVKRANELAEKIENDASSKHYAMLENDDEERSLDVPTRFENKSYSRSDRGQKNYSKLRGTDNGVNEASEENQKVRETGTKFSNESVSKHHDGDERNSDVPTRFENRSYSRNDRGQKNYSKPRDTDNWRSEKPPANTTLSKTSAVEPSATTAAATTTAATTAAATTTAATTTAATTTAATTTAATTTAATTTAATTTAATTTRTTSTPNVAASTSSSKHSAEESSPTAKDVILPANSTSKFKFNPDAMPFVPSLKSQEVLPSQQQLTVQPQQHALNLQQQQLLAQHVSQQQAAAAVTQPPQSTQQHSLQQQQQQMYTATQFPNNYFPYHVYNPVTANVREVDQFQTAAIPFPYAVLPPSLAVAGNGGGNLQDGAAPTGGLSSVSGVGGNTLSQPQQNYQQLVQSNSLLQHRGGAADNKFQPQMQSGGNLNNNGGLPTHDGNVPYQNLGSASQQSGDGQNRNQPGAGLGNNSSIGNNSVAPLPGFNATHFVPQQNLQSLFHMPSYPTHTLVPLQMLFPGGLQQHQPQLNHHNQHQSHSHNQPQQQRHGGGSGLGMDHVSFVEMTKYAQGNSGGNTSSNLQGLPNVPFHGTGAAFGLNSGNPGQQQQQLHRNPTLNQGNW